MFTVSQLIAHAFGDYVLQSDWMANKKTSNFWAIFFHALCYSLPFLLLGPSWTALFLIFASHYLIDHYRLARYVCYLKNFLAPPSSLKAARNNVMNTITSASSLPLKIGDKVRLTDNDEVWVVTNVNVGTVNVECREKWWHKWAECVGTGYHESRPAWMTVWLMIITDNLMHICCNAFALRYF